jgi:hypothetical protein
MRFIFSIGLALSVIGFLACKKGRDVTASRALVWSASGSWTPAMEADFGKFVQRIGDARWADNLRQRPTDLADWKALIGYDPGSCVFLKDCIKNPKVNPYYSEADKALTIEADCGDVPAMLRGYFAFKKKLPFIYEMSTHEPPKDSGIFPPRLVVSQSDIGSMNELFTEIRDNVHAHFYRTPVGVEHTDTYPVKVTRDTIKPGTVAYYVGGHAMMVFRVKADGTPLVIQGHPGEENGNPPSYFSVARISEVSLPQDFTYKSGGFRNWRPYVGSNQASFVNGGAGQNTTVKYENTEGLIFAFDKDLPDLDKTGSNFQQKYQLSSGKSGDFQAYVKSGLCTTECGKRRTTEIREMLYDICSLLKGREDRVQSALRAGLSKGVHPGLPEDIYNAKGAWEGQSTPGYDVRIRSSYTEIVREMRYMANAVANKTGEVIYSGSKAELANLFQTYFDEVTASQSCQVAVNGETGAFTLNVITANEKLGDMSFDPYHCPELRWGIKANCSAEQQKYYAEEILARNVFDSNKRPAPGGMTAPGLPAQLERGPASAPPKSEYMIQDAITALKK